MSRRSSEQWADPAVPEPAALDVLVPTAGREAELAVTLAGLAAQDEPGFRVVISDQSDAQLAFTAPAVQAMVRVLAAQGRAVEVLDHRPRRGMAEHRQFLLERSSAPAVLYLDDDIWLEPGALAAMHRALRRLGCGFVGSAPQGLSYLDDRRPDEEAPFQPWDGGIQPERLGRDRDGFERVSLHNAANLAHIAQRERPDPRFPVPYHVAWVGGCVLFDRQALMDAGGFEFWSSVPPTHAGEDVAAQWRVMARRGGVGLLPSGAVHLEAPTTIPDRPLDLFDVIAPG